MFTSWSEVSTPALLSIASVLTRPPFNANSIRPSWVSPRLPPSPTTFTRRSWPSTRIESLALSPTSASFSVDALTYVPMPPFHSRSTGALRMARISSAGVILVAVDSMPSAAFTCGVTGTDFALRGKTPPPVGDQRGVVVRPGGARQFEHAAPLGVRRGRVRIGVEEDVPVVEGGDQADVLGEQHAVAEDVTGHVADADGGEVLGLGVVAQLAEVPLDRLPRAARGDAHALVVVARGTAGGEGVPEPEAVRLRHLVGDVGERRGALVGGDDQVVVVTVVPDDVLGVDDVPADEVVGDVQQPGDERLVAGDALGQPGVPVDGRIGQPLADEAALGADRDDDRVLDLLRLDQAEDLRTEVLAPVRPAQPAARDLAEPQVHALDAG